MQYITIQYTTNNLHCTIQQYTGAGITADESETPDRMAGGGTKVCPASAPLSMEAKTDCHDACTDSGACETRHG